MWMDQRWSGISLRAPWRHQSVQKNPSEMFHNCNDIHTKCNCTFKNNFTKVAMHAKQYASFNRPTFLTHSLPGGRPRSPNRVTTHTTYTFLPHLAHPRSGLWRATCRWDTCIVYTSQMRRYYCFYVCLIQTALHNIVLHTSFMKVSK